MKKACIFDFDGVIVDSESEWEIVFPDIAKKLYGDSIAKHLANVSGLSMDSLHKIAITHGSTVPITDLFEACDKAAQDVYIRATQTEGITSLLDTLQSLNYLLAIVSASPRSWLDIALKQLEHADAFTLIISLQDRSDLAHKPDPAGYIEAMKLLGVTSENTMIIEDSNTGMQAAHASGAYCIGLTQNHPEGYIIKNADIIVNEATDIIEIAKKF